MNLDDIKEFIPVAHYNVLQEYIKELRPAQEKAINVGLFEGKNILVCTPTASGKTLIAELASIKRILENKGKAVYIVPLKALASEKYRVFKERYNGLIKVAMSIGDIDKNDSYLADFDLIITTSEKLDSLIRHHSKWIRDIATVIVDEVHLLHDPGRGPTLEILLTMLRQMVDAQIVALSATIGNPEELASWLKAELVEDSWRPVELKKGILVNGEIKYY